MFCQAGRQKRRCSDIKITTSARDRRGLRAGRGKRGEGQEASGSGNAGHRKRRRGKDNRAKRMPAGNNGECGKTRGSPPCGERENRVRCGSADRKKEGRRQRKQESGQAVRLRRWERKRSKARRGESARGRRNGAPGMEEKQGAERGTRSRLRRRGGKVGGEARHKGPIEGENEARCRKRQESARPQAGSPPPVSPRPALPQSTSCPGCAAGDGRFRRRQKKTPARKPAFACGNRAGRIGTSPLAVFQSLREGIGHESAAGRLPARRITPAASPLLSACAASEKERPRPSDSSAA